MLGVYPGLTVAIIITSVSGNVCAPMCGKLFRFTHPVAKDVTTGSSFHAIGTVKAMEMGEVNGVISSLSIIVPRR